MSDERYKVALKRIEDAARYNKTELDLSVLNLTTLPEEISALTMLQNLQLNANQITAIPESISNLVNLKRLQLSQNQFTGIPESITSLAELQMLDLSNNQITALPKSLGNLANLTSLHLSNNRITRIPETIAGLTNLRDLYLSGNRIPAIPGSFDKLRKLERLFLSDNVIREIPQSLGNLKNLQELSLSANQITAIPESLGGLAKLHSLYLWRNHIAEIPESLGYLVNLRELYLQKNNITSVPESLGNLTKLRELSLSGNQITAIPQSFNNLTQLWRLYMHDNPRLGIPAEVIGPDPTRTVVPQSSQAKPAEILEYYFRAEATGRPLNEAKLILVGRGGVGKSSLVEKLIYNTFTAGKTKTEGIDIERWEIPIDDEKVRLNVWDFGGQEIMHATHQFFLTERSLYLLVLNGRDGIEEADAEYWLKLIESFGAHSPVIVALNKIREHPFDLNQNGLMQKYPNIRKFIRTDCGDNTGIEELKKSIFSETATLDELRVRFPGEWFEVKDKLASMKKNYLSFNQYRNLCKRNKVGRKNHQEMLARYLNQLGIVLNYKDDLRLRDTHVLNPHWVTEGIYKILNSALLEENHGEIHLDDISRILPEKDYPGHMCRFIFDLMKKFDLCFSFPDDESHYLIPELLSKNEPKEAVAFNRQECLNFQFHYPVLPEGLLPRFITRTHHLSDGEPRWRSGVILKFEGCRALVKADAVEKKAFISITGKNDQSRRRLLAVIRADFERIHRDIKNLNPEEIIPLPGLPDKTEPYKDLLVMEEKGVSEISRVIGDDVKTFPVRELIDRVDLPRSKDKDRKEISLFYSYSHKDESFRLDLETHLKILQR